MGPVGHLEIKKQIMMNQEVLGEDFRGRNVNIWVTRIKAKIN